MFLTDEFLNNEDKFNLMVKFIDRVPYFLQLSSSTFQSPNANMATFCCSQTSCHHFSHSLFQSVIYLYISLYIRCNQNSLNSWLLQNGHNKRGPFSVQQRIHCLACPSHPEQILGTQTSLMEKRGTSCYCKVSCSSLILILSLLVSSKGTFKIDLTNVSAYQPRSRIEPRDRSYFSALTRSRLSSCSSRSLIFNEKCWSKIEF